MIEHGAGKEEAKTGIGVREGCSLSPLIFSAYA